MNIKTVNKGFGICIAVLSFLLIISSSMGMRINLDVSLPAGIWWEVSDSYSTGDYVLLDFKKAGPLGYSRGYSEAPTYLGKKIVAGPGDRVESSPDGIVVNGKVLPTSKSLLKDSQGLRLLPWSGNKNLPPNTYFVLGEHSRSYDSRYFGPVKKDYIYKRIKPVITF